MDERRQLRLDYIIGRMALNKVGSEGIEKDEVIPDEFKIREAEELFGSRRSFLPTIDRMASNLDVVFTKHSHEDVTLPLAKAIYVAVGEAKDYIEVTNPHSKERRQLELVKKMGDKEFLENWGGLEASIKRHYPISQISTDFYSGEFKANTPESLPFSYAKDEFLQDWEKALLIREINYELEVLNLCRRRFEKLLSGKLSDFRELCREGITDPDIISLFWSNGFGEWKPYELNLLQTYSKLFRKDHSINKLISELGRDGAKQGEDTVSVNIASRMRKFSHAQKSDVVGIRESDDLGSMLPIELGFFSEPNLETIFFKRFTEKKLQTFAYESHITKYELGEKKIDKLEPEKKGPFVICIDTSGSMSGAPEKVSKAISYGLIIKSQQQKRACFLISFSVGCEMIDISDFQNNKAAIMSFLNHSFNGGTDFSPALSSALKKIAQDKKFKNADVLFISDFICNDFDPPTAKSLEEAQSTGTKVHGLIIGRHYTKSILRRFDYIWDYACGNIKLRPS